MADKNDLLGRKPIRKKPIEQLDDLSKMPSFKDLCKPLSGKIVAKRSLAYGVNGIADLERGAFSRRLIKQQ